MTDLSRTGQKDITIAIFGLGFFVVLAILWVFFGLTNALLTVVLVVGFLAVIGAIVSRLDK